LLLVLIVPALVTSSSSDDLHPFIQQYRSFHMQPRLFSTFQPAGSMLAV